MEYIAERIRALKPGAVSERDFVVAATPDGEGGYTESIVRWDADTLGTQPTTAELESVGLPIAKRLATATVNARRDQVLGAGYQHNFGGSAGVRTLDNRNLSDARNWLILGRRVDRMVAAGDEADLVTVRDAANENFTASAETVQTALIAMEDWGTAVLGVSWALRDAIEAAEDETALGAIDLDAGWPE